MVRRLFALFRNLLHRNVVEQELDEELGATLDIIIEEKMRQGSFGALALILAVIGIYGVISYSIVQQAHEIGVRMALGARRSNILLVILEKGMMLAIIGVTIGIGGALALTRVLCNMLFEIKPTDPATFIGVALLLLIAALAACYIPARQATKSDPMAALRNE
jgi:putative ABC transport system permease protein